MKMFRSICNFYATTRANARFLKFIKGHKNSYEHTRTFCVSMKDPQNEAKKVSDSILSALRTAVGEKNVSTSLAVREQYSTDESCHKPVPAEAVIFAHSTEDVSKVARICNEASVPMIPHGTGTGLEQGVGAIEGGICVDLSQMTSVLEVHEEDFDVVVEPGVTWQDLNQYLRSTGLMFPVDPGAFASLGGMSATGASGTNAVRYGTMKENVINLEVVLADGTIIDTAGKARRPRKSAAGYNLTNLFVGSEGTLGFITKITLRLHAIPETMASAVCSFPDVKSAVDTVIQTMQSNIPIARIEFVDEISMKIANEYSQLDYPVASSLFLEFHGTQSEVEAQANAVEEIASLNSGSNFMWAKDTESRNKLWKARHNLYYATLSHKKGHKCITTDACVPISKLTEMIVETKKDIEASGVFGAIIGHVGDGNFHSELLFDPKDQKHFKLAKEVEHRLNLRALDLNGTCTGEHGIGTGKMDLLVEEFGDAGVSVMQKIKLALDPKNLMNPGKVFKIMP